MRRPKSVKILGEVYKIEFCEQVLDDDGTIIWAKILFDDHKILVTKNRKWRKHLFHEICHGILYVSGFSENMGEKREESLVMLLETGLYQLVNLNFKTGNFTF